MALVDNLHCSIGHFKIVTLNGTVNVGITLNKIGESNGDTIVLGDEKFPVDEIKNMDNTKASKALVPLNSNGVNPINHEY